MCFTKVMTKLILIFVIVFSAFSLWADNQDTVTAASEKMENALQESIDYNRSLILSLQRMHDKKSAEDGIKDLEDTHLKWKEAMQKTKEFVDYLKENDLSGKDLHNFRSIMSRYRLQTLIQLDQLLREKDRLVENDGYGCLDELKQRVGSMAYIAHGLKNKELKNQDTRDRITEYTEKTVKTANALLDRLERISDPETARLYAAQLPSLLKELQADNDIMNLYLYDDFEGGKQLLPSLSREFYAINSRLVDEIERIRQSDFYHDSSLQKFVVALGFPILRLLDRPVEKPDKIDFSE